MQISQADFRTVKIEKDSVTLLLRYSLYQNGEERLPESITCRGEHTVAYFLTSTIRDFIASTDSGFSVVRSWSVLTEGELALSFCLDFPELVSAAYLFPGMACGEYVPKEGFLADGELTAYPNALYLFAGSCSVLIFSDPPRSESESGSVQCSRLVLDDEPFLRVEVRFPPARRYASAENKGRRSGGAAEAILRSSGSFEHTLRLNVLIAPAKEIHKCGVSAALSRCVELAHPLPFLSAAVAAGNLLGRIKEEIRRGLDLLLVNEGGICGLRAAPDSSVLSAYAGSGMSYLLQKLLAGQEGMAELSLRLADFSLKGQHPSGLFYEAFSMERKSWLELHRSRKKAPQIVSEQAAGTAWFLVHLAALLNGKGLPFYKYLHAATRAASALYACGLQPADCTPAPQPDYPAADRKEKEVLSLLEPIWELYRLTGKDQYKKALSVYREKYFSEAPQGVHAETNVHSALLLARCAVLLAETGYPLKDLEAYFSGLLPWIYINRRPGDSSLNPVGGILESLGGKRLLFRGFEVSYLLLKCNSLIPTTRRLRAIKELLPQLLSFTLQRPVGTSCFALAGGVAPAPSPIAARTLVRELFYMLKLQEEFPEVVRKF